MLIMKYHMIAQNLTDLLYISPFRNGSYDKECELQYMYSPFSFNLHFLHFCYTRRSKLESLINIQHNKYAFIIFSTNLSLYYSIILVLWVLTLRKKINFFKSCYSYRNWMYCIWVDCRKIKVWEFFRFLSHFNFCFLLLLNQPICILFIYK